MSTQSVNIIKLVDEELLGKFGDPVKLGAIKREAVLHAKQNVIDVFGEDNPENMDTRVIPFILDGFFDGYLKAWELSRLYAGLGQSTVIS